MAPSSPLSPVLSAILWPPGIGGQGAADADKLYVILDTARDEQIYGALLAHETELPMQSLYQGDLAVEMADVAPYIVALEPGAPFARWLVAQGWGESWGIFLRSREPLDAVRRHFRKFTLVNDEQGKQLLFRFYDPRVLRDYLPTCPPEDLARLFAPVSRFLVEDADGRAAINFEFIGGELRRASQPL